ncbi:MAG TPA: TIR domain-containing protein [Candidatus Methanoperedens sp.]|nr:TIR domain-containing protein [Candidatus Methanoperedens sp.]
MPKEVFLASSSEGREAAERIAAVLEDVPGVKSRLWYKEFHSGDITFVRIQELSREVAGAIIVATPDDDSVIRGEAARVPRSNVVFEYGFLSSSLGLSRVALCRYDTVHIPSDLGGVTYIPMGRWPSKEIDAQATVKIKDWARDLPQDALGGLAAEIQHYEGRLKELRHTYGDVLDGKVEQSRRNISFQLEVLEEKLRRTRAEGRPSSVSILGVNATGPLHQGRELMIQLLREGGNLRLLTLDPDSVAFRDRCDHEYDSVGRIGAELQASFFILLDILDQLRGRSPDGPAEPNVEVRLHHRNPDRSLIIIDEGRDDGIVLENPYPALRGTRGVQGQMYPLVQRGRTTRGYLENVKYFDKLWGSAATVKVRGSDDLRTTRFPFTRS